MSAREPKPGDVLDGRFRLIEELGRGGMATIFKAHDLDDRCRAVAVKLPLPSFARCAASRRSVTRASPH